jgi:hypothetical protein
MNKTSKTLLMIGGGLGAFALSRYLYKTLVLADKWDFEYKGIRPISAYPNLEGELLLDIINVSDVRLELRNVRLEAFVSRVKVGYIQQEELNIAPNGRSLIKIRLKVDYGNLVKALGSAFKDIKTFSDVPVQILGFVEAKGLFGWMTLPVNYKTTGKELKQMYDEA